MSGEGVSSYFSNESGCHRWVRVPPTERKGRTQTSVVTVAITTESEFKYELDKSLVKRQYTCSGGKGGQHVNRRSTCVQLTHVPTGTQVKVQDARTQGENEVIAWKRLEEKLSGVESGKHQVLTSRERFDQIGYSNRSTKKRTYKVKDNEVIDHETNKSCSYKDFAKGRIELLK